jgi:hypothetical protein
MKRHSAGRAGDDAPSSNQPVHLSGHHRDTISQILRHPVSHNIEWRAVLSLLQAAAHVEETHDGMLLVTLGDEAATFEPPDTKTPTRSRSLTCLEC